ncbi:MAG: DNA primase [Sphingobacteriales bacterium]|nr:MAG: DNA primase [Sphingobacteriales bacterium]
MSNHLSIMEAKSLDMVGYLESLGYSAQKIRGHDWWYLSPLRDEKTPSFKVDRKLNLWYDHGAGKGGNLVDFGVLFYRCSVKEFLQKLMEVPIQNFSFHPPISSLRSSPESEEKKLFITSVKPLTSPRFYNYISSRKIDVVIAKQYLKEVAFELNGKPYTALGFENNSGGYELRNEHFKGSSSPKDVTVIGRGHSENVAVFEGVFSFLSYLSFIKKIEEEREV